MILFVFIIVLGVTSHFHMQTDNYLMLLSAFSAAAYVTATVAISAWAVAVAFSSFRTFWSEITSPRTRWPASAK